MGNIARWLIDVKRPHQLATSRFENDLPIRKRSTRLGQMGIRVSNWLPLANHPPNIENPATQNGKWHGHHEKDTPVVAQLDSVLIAMHHGILAGWTCCCRQAQRQGAHEDE